MNDENQFNTEGNSPEMNSAEELSKADAMSGVFTAPSETFETIAAFQRKNYWLIPLLISIALGLVSTFLFMQDAELTAKTMDKQKLKMQEKFNENVKQGKMTQEEADKALESINPKGTFFKLIGFGGALIGPIIIFFMLSVVYMILLKIMKAEFEFTNIMNVVGLAFLIAAIGNIISMVISITKGDISNIGPALFMNAETSGEKVYSLLSKIDLFTIWFYTVIAIGISKIAKIDMIKSASMVFGIWLIYVVVASLAF